MEDIPSVVPLGRAVYLGEPITAVVIYVSGFNPNAVTNYVALLGRAVYLGEPTTAVIRPILNFP